MKNLKEQVKELTSTVVDRLMNDDFEIKEVTEKNVIVNIDGFEVNVFCMPQYKRASIIGDFYGITDIDAETKEKLYNKFAGMIAANKFDVLNSEIDRLQKELKTL